MSKISVQTADGIKEVSRERLAALVAAGKFPRDRKIVTTDNGLTWCTAGEALGHQVATPAAQAFAATPLPHAASVPQQPHAVTEPKTGTPILVIVSFVLSGLSLILVCLSGIPAIICAAIAMRHPAQRRLASIALFVAIGMTVVTTAGLAIIARLDPDGFAVSGGGGSRSTVAPDTGRSSGAARNSASEPESQTAFVRIMKEATEQYRGARNEIGEAASRDSRRRALQASFPSPSVEGWVGRITEISTNMDGLGVLAVSIGPDITLTTSSTELSDFGTNSLIPKSSPIYQTLMNLNVGDRVVVSGRFAPGEEDHFEERSLTLMGSMLEPAFTFVFRSVEPVR